MKSLLVKELSWFVIGSIIAIPLAFIFVGLFKLSTAGPEPNEVEEIFYFQLLFIGWIVSLVAVYIVRVVVSAIRSKM